MPEPRYDETHQNIDVSFNITAPNISGKTYVNTKYKMPFCISCDNVKSVGDRNKISLNKKPLR